jgi:autotransporter-associated beta strand protein
MDTAITMTVDSGSQLNYSGTLHNKIGSAGGVSKAGAGTLTLSGNNSYTGPTTVSNGKLVVNGNISTSTTTVENGGTLGGNGMVGAVTVQSGGTLAIGNSPGTMTYTGDLTLSLGSISDFEINSFVPGEFDLALAAVSGSQAVNFNGGTLNLLFQSGFSTMGTIKIFDFDTYAGSGFTTVNATGLASGYAASFNSLDGTLTVVPEPRAALISGIGLLALLRRRRA